MCRQCASENTSPSASGGLGGGGEGESQIPKVLRNTVAKEVSTGTMVSPGSASGTQPEPRDAGEASIV